ncbi:hypothetical protein ACFUMH_04015 [Cellulomonas sp. NPDC057328]|uniref:hypothetical protein n=1 Tax=Cellulomonas sp. NPDC057328 TaxID=3346101 RepID=UPI00362CF348
MPPRRTSRTDLDTDVGTRRATGPPDEGRRATRGSRAARWSLGLAIGAFAAAHGAAAAFGSVVADAFGGTAPAAGPLFLVAAVLWLVLAAAAAVLAVRALRGGAGRAVPVAALLVALVPPALAVVAVVAVRLV